MRSSVFAGASALAINPPALVTAYLQAQPNQSRPLSGQRRTPKPHMRCGSGDGVRIARSYPKSYRRGLPDVADALGLALGSPVLVVDRTSYTNDSKPLEVVIGSAIAQAVPVRVVAILRIGAELSRNEISHERQATTLRTHVGCDG